MSDIEKFKDWFRSYFSRDITDQELDTHLEDLKQYERYRNKLNLLGGSTKGGYIDCFIDEQTGRILCNSLLPGLGTDESKVNDTVNLYLNVPSFVEGFVISVGDDTFDFRQYAQGKHVSLKVDYPGNRFNTSYKDLFSLLRKVVYLDLSGFSFEYAVDISCMFEQNNQLRKIVFKPGVYENVNNISGLFSWCHQLREINTCDIKMPNVMYLTNTFCRCTSLRDIDLSFLCSGKNIQCMTSTFSYQGVRHLNLDWLTPRELTPDTIISMDELCNNCLELVDFQCNNGKLNQIPVSSMQKIFNGCKKLEHFDIGQLSVDNVSSLQCAFYDCSELRRIDLSNKNFQNLHDVKSLLKGCRQLECLDIQNSTIGRLDDAEDLLYETRDDFVIDVTDTNFIAYQDRYGRRTKRKYKVDVRGLVGPEPDIAGDIDNFLNTYYFLNITLPDKQYSNWIDNMCGWKSDKKKVIQPANMIINLFENNHIQVRKGKEQHSLRIYKLSEVPEQYKKLYILKGIENSYRYDSNQNSGYILIDS